MNRLNIEKYIAINYIYAEIIKYFFFSHKYYPDDQQLLPSLKKERIEWQNAHTNRHRYRYLTSDQMTNVNNFLYY